MSSIPSTVNSHHNGRSRFLAANRRWNLLLVGIGIVVLLMIISFLLVVLSFFLADKPPKSSKIRRRHQITRVRRSLNLSDPEIPSLTDACSAALGHCYYYKRKYVSSCTIMQCSSLSVRVSLQQVVINGIALKATPAFHPISEESQWAITVPEGAPCIISSNNEIGRCSKQYCESVESDRLNKYKNSMPINGGYEEVMPKDGNYQCIIMLEHQGITLSPLFERECKPSNPGLPCQVYPVHLLKCTDPKPDRGGRLCFDESHTRLLYNEWPLRLGVKCNECKFNATSPNTSCPPSPELPCVTYQENSLATQDDFTSCCLHSSNVPTDYAYGKQAICLVGLCVPTDVPVD